MTLGPETPQAPGPRAPDPRAPEPLDKLVTTLAGAAQTCGEPALRDLLLRAAQVLHDRDRAAAYFAATHRAAERVVGPMRFQRTDAGITASSPADRLIALAGLATADISLIDRIIADAGALADNPAAARLAADLTRLRDQAQPRPADGIDALADAWASIDGRVESYRAGRHDGDPAGRHAGYTAEAEEMARRLARRGYRLVPIDTRDKEA